MKFLVEVSGRRFEVECNGSAVSVDGRPVAVPADLTWRRRMAEYVIDHDGVILPARILPRGTPKVSHRGDAGGAVVTVIEAPLPGLVRSVLREPGDAVRRGEAVLTLDAMKLENEIQSPVDGIVREVRVAEGRAVDKGDVLAVIEESE